MIEETLIEEITASTLIRTGPGLLYAVHVSCVGVTAADSVEIYDGLNAITGVRRLYLVATATNENLSYEPCNPARFNTGIYVLVTLGMKASSAAHVTIQYS